MAGPYYVSDATGDDLDDGLSEGNAFKTIQKALDTVAAGEQIHIKADGTYYEALTAPVVGTLAAPIHIDGYTNTPGDGGLATIDGNGKTLVSGMDYVGTVTANHVYSYLRFTDFSSHGFNGLAVSSLVFRYCEFDDNGGTGLSAKDNISILACHFHDNANTGAYLDGAGVIVGCLFRNNLNGLGMQGVSNFVYNSIAAGNSNIGIQVVNGLCILVNNTVWGNNKDTVTGIDIVNAVRNVLVNNIVTECVTGITSNTADNWNAKVAFTNNLVYDCTTPYNVNAATEIGGLTGDPLLVDPGNGDFSLGGGSPAVDVGAWPTNSPNAPASTGDLHFLGAVAPDADDFVTGAPNAPFYPWHVGGA
jgi:hypothetical protein